MLGFVKKYGRRHLVVIIIISFASLLSAGSVYAMSVWGENKVKEIAASAKAENAKTDAAIKRILKKKAEEEAKAKAEAQRKAEAAKKAQAAAKKKAEAAKRTAAGVPQTAGTCTSRGVHSNPAALDIIVNKKHCINPLYFAPSDLVTVYGAVISAKASANFAAMYNAARAAGVPFNVTSSYRSYASQVETYNHWVAVNGRAGADTVSARPGYSEHQTGLSVDLAAGTCALECFARTAQYRWLQAHAASYGFIERYPAGYSAVTGYSPEAWHYRYVGPSVAKALKSNGVRTLEQYWGVTGGGY